MRKTNGKAGDGKRGGWVRWSECEAWQGQDNFPANSTVTTADQRLVMISPDMTSLCQVEVHILNLESDLQVADQTISAFGPPTNTSITKLVVMMGNRLHVEEKDGASQHYHFAIEIENQLRIPVIHP